MMEAACYGKTEHNNFPYIYDCRGAGFDLQKLLEHYAIVSELCYDGRIDKLSEEDYIVCVDFQKHSGNVMDFIGDEVACVDHHPTFTPIEYRYRDVCITGACATLIAEYYKEAGLEPDSDMATAALLYGLKMDTLQFTRGVTDLDIQMFRFLFSYSDQEKLSDPYDRNFFYG